MRTKRSAASSRNAPAFRRSRPSVPGGSTLTRADRIYRYRYAGEVANTSHEFWQATTAMRGRGVERAERRTRERIGGSRQVERSARAELFFMNAVHPEAAPPAVRYGVALSKTGYEALPSHF